MGISSSGSSLAGAGYYLHAGMLFDVARTTYVSLPTGSSDRDYGSDGALVCIVFATACLEAFINELSAIALYLHDPNVGWGMYQTSHGAQPLIHMTPGMGRTIDPLVVFEMGEALDRAENDHKGPRVKYEIALSMLSGGRTIKGEQPYQDLALLISVRDQIVHTKTQEYDVHDDRLRSEQSAKLLRRLEDKGVTAVMDSPHVTTSLLGWVATRAAARWACNTAAVAVNTIIDRLPQGDSKQVLKAAFGERFPRVDDG